MTPLKFFAMATIILASPFVAVFMGLVEMLTTPHRLIKSAWKSLGELD